MTISNLISNVKSVNAKSAHADTVFLMWVNELEADIQLKLWLLSVEDVIEHTELTEELLADAAHSIVYRLYLNAMIDLANGEYTSYQNNYKVFSDAYGDYKCWYIMKYHPGTGEAEELGYYLSAYALAVKHGYEGTEEEWIAAVESARLSAEESAAAAHASAEAAALCESNMSENTEAAIEAAGAALSAKDSAEAASASAVSAANAAQAAQDAAELAEAHAETAEANADTAEGGAVNAKNDAISAKDASVIAQTAAEAAQSAADTARLAAETAQGQAETAKSAAENAQSGAISAKDASVIAQTAAEAAQGLAEAANTAAQGAKTAAEAAKTAAETAQGLAEGHAEDAEAWADGTINGVAVANTHPAYQNNAQHYKDQAAAIVGGDYPTKTEAQGYVDAHDENGTAHSTLFAEKQGATNSLAAETALDDADVIPFYDTSATANRKTLWSNIKSVLKTYFDTLYNNYTHPTTSGNKHIPTGGASGQCLKYSADGTAAWGTDNDTVYSHPTGDGNLHVPATSTTNSGKVLTAGATAGSLSWTAPATTLYEKIRDIADTSATASISLDISDIDWSVWQEIRLITTIRLSDYASIYLRLNNISNSWYLYRLITGEVGTNKTSLLGTLLTAGNSPTIPAIIDVSITKGWNGYYYFCGFNKVISELNIFTGVGYYNNNITDVLSSFNIVSAMSGYTISIADTALWGVRK